MKFVSWNVNGLRACITKGFFDFFDKMDADIFAIQESKMQEDQIDFNVFNYYRFMSSAEKKGYSGTIIFTKEMPISCVYGINGKYNDEGRVITLEYDKFYFVNVYTPNSKRELERLDYRMVYEDDLRNYLNDLDKVKPVILCGDLNVAHKEIDLKYPKQNLRSAGFTIEERTKLSALLDSGFVDSFRYLYPDTIKYSWWSYMFKSREKNIGWRIDYFITSERIKEYIKEAEILNDVLGSDHCPVTLEIEV